MKNDRKEGIIFRTAVILTMIVLAAALRIVPHPWNLAPIGAMALFSGAMLRNRWLSFLFPLLALFVGDVFLGFHKLMPVVYASFLINVALGLWLRDRRIVSRISAVIFLGAIQFFVITNFAVWAFGLSYPRTFAGLVACYVAGTPFFWNTLAGDALYATLLFGGFALAERIIPAVRGPAPEHRSMEYGH
jgi:hypothetical protein